METGRPDKIKGTIAYFKCKHAHDAASDAPEDNSAPDEKRAQLFILNPPQQMEVYHKDSSSVISYRLVKNVLMCPDCLQVYKGSGLYEPLDGPHIALELSDEDDSTTPGSSNDNIPS